MKLCDQFRKRHQDYLSQKQARINECKEKALKLINAIDFKTISDQVLLTTDVIDNAVKREYDDNEGRDYVEMPEETLNSIGIELWINAIDDIKYQKCFPDFEIFDECFKCGRYLDDWICNSVNRDQVKYDDITQTINHKDCIEERTVRYVKGPVQYLIYINKTYKFDFVMRYLKKQGFKIEKDRQYPLYRLYF